MRRYQKSFDKEQLFLLKKAALDGLLLSLILVRIICNSFLVLFVVCFLCYSLFVKQNIASRKVLNTAWTKCPHVDSTKPKFFFYLCLIFVGSAAVL